LVHKNITKEEKERGNTRLVKGSYTHLATERPRREVIGWKGGFAKKERRGKPRRPRGKATSALSLRNLAG